ncbi:linker histone H1 and H5 family protein [Dictyocaulus viviparus]|uniref:Linker histone H1 and H5 family protein n=1 Tax=Dictyocaulus viviparus TaxID=29172 RepID=A0A0D8Y3F6_DICVI|nr:linker histone H1 and H5 family protein [Dictyocaulus viviparus]
MIRSFVPIQNGHLLYLIVCKQMSADVAAGLTKVAKVPRPPRVHPTYSEMVRIAITELHDSSGSSKAAILRYLVEHYQLGNNNNLINSNIRLALKRGVERGEFKQLNGTGANGSFKLTEKKAVISSAKDDNVTNEKKKAVKFENRGTTTTKKSKVEKEHKTPIKPKPTSKKAKTTKSAKIGKSTTSRSTKSARKPRAVRSR